MLVLSRLAEALPLAAPVIVDAGANKGRTVDAFLALYPGALVLAYEPVAELARKLAKRYAADPRVAVRALALGDSPGLMTLNVLNRRTCSSLLEPAAISDKHAGAGLYTARKDSVRVVRLDQQADQPPHILKMDVQGYELSVLRGAEALLGGVLAVVAEVSFRMLYEGQALAHEVTAWLEARGFVREGLYDPWTDEAGRMVSADALFLRRGGV